MKIELKSLNQGNELIALRLCHCMLHSQLLAVF
jgi:hypothetical protein